MSDTDDRPILIVSLHVIRVRGPSPHVSQS